VNELLDRVRDRPASPPFDEIATLSAVPRAAGRSDRDASLEAKINVMIAVLGRGTVSVGKQPFQDCNLLIQIRDFLVHPGSDTIHLNKDGSLPKNTIWIALPNAIF
jgi:hypothetical protein